MLRTRWPGLMGAAALVLSLVSPAASAQAATPTPADCTIFVTNGYGYGTAGDDVICGTPGDDIILGYGGSDTIFGFAGNDYINAGAGADWIDGGVGNDTLFGGSGNDYLNGGPGSDKLFGSAGLDNLIGAAGDDVLNGGAGADSLSGGAGIDYCTKDKADHLSSCYYDTSPPRLYAVAANTSSVNTALAPATEHFRVHLLDTGTGLSRFQLHFLRLTGNTAVDTYDGPVVQLSAFPCTAAHESMDAGVCPISGTLTNGIYDVAINLPRWSPARTYRLIGVEMTDRAGNAAIVDSDSLVARKMAVSFRQVAAGDATAPGLREHSVTSTIDTSGGPAVLTVTAHVVDALSGTQSIFMEFGRYPTVSSAPQWSGPWISLYLNTSELAQCVTGHAALPTEPSNMMTSCRTAGTDKDGYYELKVLVPRYTAQSRYDMDQFGTTDWAGNSVTLPYEFLVTTKRDMHFTQTGVGDTAAPVVSALKILDPAVNTGVADALVRVRVTARDSLAGVGSVSVTLSAPAGSQAQTSTASDLACTDPVFQVPQAGGCLESGTARNGTWVVTIALPAHAASGRWTVTQVSTGDVVGNQRDYKSPLPVALQGSVTNG